MASATLRHRATAQPHTEGLKREDDYRSEATQEELPTLLDPTTCTRKGLCPVTKLRKGDTTPLESHSLYYEMHGNGPIHIVLIMGQAYFHTHNMATALIYPATALMAHFFHGCIK
jgi:hypothetical protein